MKENKKELRVDKNGIPVVRSRGFLLLLYQENDDFKNVVKLCNDNDWEYVYALHDKDVLEDGLPSKPHYHFYIKFKNAVWNTSVSKKLNVSTRFVQKVDKENELLGYFFHIAEPDKFQYKFDAVNGYGNVYDKVYEMWKKQSFNTTEDDVMKYIIDFIMEEYPFIFGNSADKYSLMVSAFIRNGWYSTFKKNYFIIKELIFRVDKVKHLL